MAHQAMVRHCCGPREVLLASPTLNPTLNYKCKKRKRREREDRRREKREERRREKRSPTVTEKVSVK